jgi:hypothetical protein
MSLGAVDAGSAPAASTLLVYLERLAQWSRKVRAVAGPARPWLPSVIRHSLAVQWWGTTPTPDPVRLRADIANFWHQVVPWLAWHPEATAPPAPPADPELIEFVAARLDREAARWPTPGVGWSRREAFRAAASEFRAVLETGGPAGTPLIRLAFPKGNDPAPVAP